MVLTSITKRRRVFLFVLIALVLITTIGGLSLFSEVTAGGNMPLNAKVTMNNDVHFNGSVLNDYQDMSSDGRYFVFTSSADNHGLIEDTNSTYDIFLYDRVEDG